MDREYLENYELREKCEQERLIKRIQEGKFLLGKDRFPPDSRFVKLQKPVALTSSRTVAIDNVWAQVPFCGSLILLLSPVPRDKFERMYFKVSEIPKIIDFVKETGRLQFALTGRPTLFSGLDYLSEVFEETQPPLHYMFPLLNFENRIEIGKAVHTFEALGKVRFYDFLYEGCKEQSTNFQLCYENCLAAYVILKLGRYTVVEDIENLMIDDAGKAFVLLSACLHFIINPIADLRSDLRNFTLEEIRTSQLLPLAYQPKELRFPCEIGKFLLKKLTYAPYGLDACKEIMYHYDSYDMRRVLEALNEAIMANDPDAIDDNINELSKILDNVWEDSTIPKRVKNLRIGVPLSMAAIGSVTSGPIGAIGGFLAGLGFNVVDRYIDVETDGLSERFAKLRTKSYQANVYDFKKKYKHNVI